MTIRSALACIITAAIAANSVAGAAGPTKLVLQIHEVVCVDETDSGSIIGEHGDDNMILGAITIAPNGKRTPVRTVKVGTFSHDGVRKRFESPLTLASIPVSPGKQRDYGVLLVLAEQDVSGGTDAFIEKLADAGDSGPGTDDKSDGGATAVAGEVAKEILKELAKRAIKRLQENAKDDIFRPGEITATLRPSEPRFTNGNTATAPQTLTFKGHGGKYTVTYSWKLAA